MLPGLDTRVEASAPEQRLRLRRSMVSFDLETTGLDIRDDRVVEISCVKIDRDGTREILTHRVNPQMPIAKDATAVHGIRDEDVATAPTFEQLAAPLFEFFKGADLTGFNLEHFDLPLLTHEFARAGHKFPDGEVGVVDSRRIFMLKEPRDLTAAYRIYCDKELTDAHSAEADAIAAADILLAQVERYGDLPTDVQALHDFCHPTQPDWVDPDGRLLWREGKAVIGFGKHREKSLESLAKNNPGYLRWILTASFSDAVVAIVEAALRGEFPEPPEPSEPSEPPESPEVLEIPKQHGDDPR